MLGSTCTCTATDWLPVIDNWNSAAIFDSLILTPPSGQAIYSIHGHYTGKSGVKVKPQTSIYYLCFLSYVHVIKQWLKKRLKVRFILPVCMDTVVPGMR